MSLTAWLDLRMTPIGLRPDLLDPSPPLLSLPYCPLPSSPPLLFYSTLSCQIFSSLPLFPSSLSSFFSPLPFPQLCFFLFSPFSLPTPLFFSFYFSFHWYICFYTFHVSCSIFQLYVSSLLPPPLVLHSTYVALYIIEVEIIDNIREDAVQPAE